MCVEIRYKRLIVPLLKFKKKIMNHFNNRLFATWCTSYEHLGFKLNVIINTNENKSITIP